MSNSLKIKDYVLLVAAFSGEAANEFRNLGDLVPNLMSARYGFIPPNYKKSSYRAAVLRWLKSGDIAKKLAMDGKFYLEITEKGSNEIKKQFSLFTFNKKWDGEFMIVIFDVPEKERIVRNKLRKKIMSLGFGMLQESVWISPYHFENELKTYLDENGYRNYVYVLKAKDIASYDFFEKASKIWKLERLNKNYLKINSLLVKYSNKTLQLQDIKHGWKLYLETLAKDPLLPKELLPINWSRENAYDVLKQISASANLMRSSQNT